MLNTLPLKPVLSDALENLHFSHSYALSQTTAFACAYARANKMRTKFPETNTIQGALFRARTKENKWKVANGASTGFDARR
jgi:hypothetical protein